MSGDPLTDFLQSLPPDKLQAILGSGTADQQQASLERQLQQAHALRLQRMQNQPYGAAAGMAAGLGDVLGGVREGVLQNREQEALQKRQQGIEAFGQAAQGGNMQGAALLGLLSGNKQLGEMGEQLRAQTGIDLANKERAQKIAQEGPQAALGGLPPSTYEILTKRQMVPKVVQGMNGEWVDARTGKIVNNGAPSAGLNPRALDQAAEMFHTTGQLPPMGMGKAGVLVRKQIMNRVAELHPDASLAGNKGSYKADTGSLAAQQKILDNAEGWERTGKANLGVLLDISQKLSNTGSPWLNQPVRRFLEKGTGDPNMTAFRAAHATVVNEYAKILSGAQGSSAVTDSARHEAESMLPLDATPEQLIAAAKVLNTDAGNRIGAARQQVEQIKGRMSGAPVQSAPQAAPASSTAPASPSDAEALEWAKANPTDPRAAKIMQGLGAR